MKTERGTDIKPETGYAICRFVPPGKTEGGLIIPDSAQQSEGQLIIVETSGAYVVDGLRQECAARPGDRVYLNAHRKEEKDPRGKMTVTYRIRTSPVPALPDHYLIMLVDVTHFERPEHSTH